MHPAQADCVAAPAGQEPGVRDGLEVDGESLDPVTFCFRNLAIPERRKAADPKVLRGKEISYSIGCTSCHRAKFVTYRPKDRPKQSFHLIWPHSDLLLHDMGEGLATFAPPDADSLAMQGYAGSIAFSGGMIAITSPRGGVAMIHGSAGAHLATLRRADVCGAAADGNGAFTLSDGSGGIRIADPGGLRMRARHDLAWDNHLIRI